MCFLQCIKLYIGNRKICISNNNNLLQLMKILDNVQFNGYI